MTITELNECLSELPEISVLEFYRPRSPASCSLSWLEQPVGQIAYSDTKQPNAA